MVASARSSSTRRKTSAERLVAVAALDGQLDDAANVAAEVDERAGEDALAEVEADDLAGVADDAEEDRALAAGRRPASDFLDHPVAEQVADDVRDGRPGQAGAARDFGAADRPEVVDGPQDEPMVVLAGLRVGRLGGESHGRRRPLLRLCQWTGQSAGCEVSDDNVKGLDKVPWRVPSADRGPPGSGRGPQPFGGIGGGVRPPPRGREAPRRRPAERRGGRDAPSEPAAGSRSRSDRRTPGPRR